MNLENWKPIIGKGQYPGKYLFIQATLRCPFCHKSTTIQTEGHSIACTTERGLDQLIEWKLNGVIKNRACDECGIVSTLPEIDKKNLSFELHDLITLEWLKRYAD